MRKRYLDVAWPVTMLIYGVSILLGLFGALAALTVGEPYVSILGIICISGVILATSMMLLAVVFLIQEDRA